MIRNIKSWLHRPYPLMESTIIKIRVAFGFGLFVYMFLIIYQPYETSSVKFNFYWYSSGYAVTTFVGLLIGFLVIPKVLKNYYNQTRWKTRDEIIFLLINFLIVSSLIYFYKESLGNDVTYPRSYAEVVLISLSIGIFPIAILVYSVEIRMNLKNQKAAEKINKKRLEYQQLNFGVLNQRRDIVINAETQKNNIFIMQEGDFIFAQGMGNYSSIYFKNNGTISRETIRITLKNLFEQLSEDHPTILRCHRSFIINKSKIRHIRGNARSLVILLEGIEQEIPVSRSFDRKLLT